MKIVLIIFSIFSSSAALALSCISRSLPEAYDAADVVILATATESTKNSGKPELIKLQIKEYFKESFSTIKAVAIEPTKKENNIYLVQPYYKTTLKKGEDYVIFGKNISHEIISSDACKGSFSLNYVKAEQNIDKLRKFKDAIKRFKKP
ncbi:hypothetical protein [Aliikangiella sp. IMCC44632]